MDGKRRRATLYLPHADRRRSAEGESLAAEDAELIVRRTGVDAVEPIERLAAALQAAMVLYTPHCPAEGRCGSRDELRASNRKIIADCWDGRATREQHLIDTLRRRHPQLDVRDLSPTLDRLRAIKSPLEIDLCRQAGRLSAAAVTEAMRATRPGVYEYQLGAIANYLYRLAGARGEGYRHIIAGGANAWHAHYFRNDCPLADGEMVLMDGAPDFGYYTSDIGRMWPVGGTYSPVQRELYGFIVEYHKTLLGLIRPGRSADEIHDEAAAAMAKVVEATTFSKPVYQAAARRTLEFRGHLSHPVGMAVHDVGGYGGPTLSPGVVFTVDPQMWVPEEQLYVRVEDTVVVTDSGIETLTAAAPLELDDVEATMNQPPELPLP